MFWPLGEKKRQKREAHNSHQLVFLLVKEKIQNEARAALIRPRTASSRDECAEVITGPAGEHEARPKTFSKQASIIHLKTQHLSATRQSVNMSQSISHQLPAMNLLISKTSLKWLLLSALQFQ